MKEIVFHQKLLEKTYFIFKMTSAAIVWPASSDFWKLPLVSTVGMSRCLGGPQKGQFIVSNMKKFMESSIHASLVCS